jgi:glucokinase
LHRLKACAIGVPGIVEKKGSVSISKFDWMHLPLAKDLSNRLHVPVFLENDANIAAFGEWHKGHGSGALYGVVVTVGTGVGMGIIVNGKVYSGAFGMAGEIGHIRVKKSRGHRCHCGKTGCLETEASARALERTALSFALSQNAPPFYELFRKNGRILAGDVVQLAMNGDVLAQKMLAKCGRILGKTLADVATVLNPERIIIGGGIASAGEPFFKPLRHSFVQSAIPAIAKKTPILPAILGNRAGIIGAALFARQMRKELGH